MSDCFDLAIHGEGEYPLLEVCKYVRDHGVENLQKGLPSIPNVVYRDEQGEVVANPPQGFLTNLDDLPSVDYDLLDVTKYSIPTMAGKYVISMMLSRGVPVQMHLLRRPDHHGHQACASGRSTG